MNNNPYRERANVDPLVLSFKARFRHVFALIAATPGRWWRDLEDGSKVLTILVVVAALFAGIVGMAVHAEPCEKRIVAKVHGVTPEGLPADYDQSWCAEYKPGRGP